MFFFGKCHFSSLHLLSTLSQVFYQQILDLKTIFLSNDRQDETEKTLLDILLDQYTFDQKLNIDLSFWRVYFACYYSTTRSSSLFYSFCSCILLKFWNYDTIKLLSYQMNFIWFDNTLLHKTNMMKLTETIRRMWRSNDSNIRYMKTNTVLKRLLLLIFSLPSLFEIHEP